MNKIRNQSKILAVACLILALAAVSTAAAQEKKKSTIKGGGIGALLGQAIGGDTESTLIGAAIGASLGHVIGNKKDKQHAEELAEQTKEDECHHHEVDVLGNTRWEFKDITPKDLVPGFKAKIVNFRNDGTLETITTDMEGDLTMSKELQRSAAAHGVGGFEHGP